MEGKDRHRLPAISRCSHARASVARLLDPRHLGGFRVLAFGREMPSAPDLPGFALA